MALTPKDFSKARNEIRSYLRAHHDGRDASTIARYIGSVGHEKRADNEQSRLEFWGFSQGLIRQLANHHYSFCARSPAEQLDIWLDFYHASTSYDEMSVALAWIAAKSYRSLILSHHQALFSLQKKVDNWALSDGVADLISAFVEKDPKRGLGLLRKWNRSKNPWERRQSLVGLYYYSRLRRAHLKASDSLPLVKNLLRDPHYFVQKAIGWSLREIYQIDKAAQLAFVRDHVGEISGTAFFATIEKYTDRERARIKTLRAKNRRAPTAKKTKAR